jgi:hypothetical protein
MIEEEMSDEEIIVNGHVRCIRRETVNGRQVQEIISIINHPRERTAHK